MTRQKIPFFIFYGESASGKSLLATQLDSIETPTIRVIDDFICLPGTCATLLHEFMHTSQEDKLLPTMYVLVTNAHSRDVLQPLIDGLSLIDWLSITTCEFKREK